MLLEDRAAATYLSHLAARSFCWARLGWSGARPSQLYIYTLILGAQAAQVLSSGAWAVGELIGAVCEGHGREL